MAIQLCGSIVRGTSADVARRVEFTTAKVPFVKDMLAVQRFWLGCARQLDD